MLRELRKYNNLGTPLYFYELLSLLEKEGTWTKDNVSSYFFGRTIDDKDIFDGCLPLLEKTQIIYIGEDNLIRVRDAYKGITQTQKYCQRKLLEGILKAFSEDKIFYTIFHEKNMQYDIITESININFHSFTLKYTNIRDLFMSFELLLRHQNFPDKKLSVHNRWRAFFKKHILKKIRKVNLEKQKKTGAAGEEFVFKFEKMRLENKEGIQQVSLYDDSAGYDIASFESVNSQDHDRFIEVKTYARSETPYFYWTINEVSKAREHKGKYFIYLVDYNKIGVEGYKPRVIRDPAKNILDNDDWHKETNKYFIHEK